MKARALPRLAPGAHVPSTVDFIEVKVRRTLDDYSAIASLATSVRELRAEARLLSPQLSGRVIWMLSSTAIGGGVAEMMPQVVAFLCELGVATKWGVIRADPRFYSLTKRLHNLLHGTEAPRLSVDDRELYESVSRECAELLGPMVTAHDIVVVHDPQPVGIGALVKRQSGAKLLWRCHIGHDQQLTSTSAAWSFLRPYLDVYDHAIFSAPEYLQSFLAGRSSIMHPTIDPLDHKNRELSPTKLVGIFANAGLLVAPHPLLTPPFSVQVKRLRLDGTFGPAVGDHEVGMPFRPSIVQLSRWDRLKGFAPLLHAFGALKERVGRFRRSPREARRLGIVRLVLAGPDPSAIQDDPEATEVLAEIAASYCRLNPELAKDVAILLLPMASRKENALTSNCLQRCATISVQNSLREGFSLTVMEAMWKGLAVLGSRACGIRQQIRDGLDGRLVADAEDPETIAAMLDAMLSDSRGRTSWGRSAQRRVYDEFLIFRQVQSWLKQFVACGELLSRPLRIGET
jgi:trehalose synthase